MVNLIEEVSITEKLRWNDIVKSFPDYDVFYLNEYAYAFQLEDRLNGEPILLYYRNNADKAISVVFKRDIALEKDLKGKIEYDKYYDLISPYGYGGFKGKISDYKGLNRAYNEYCFRKNYVCEFVRFELLDEYREHYDGCTETRMHNIVRDLSLSMGQIWMDFRAKVRKNVNRANSYKLRIVIDNTGKYLKDFLHIYYSTMERANAKKEYYFSEGFYETINLMSDNVMYFYVLYKEKVISAELIIYGTENAYSYLGGTDSDFFELRPNDFLKYEIIKWCKEKGLKYFVLGGGYGMDDGIFQYKKNLAPNGIVDFYIGHKIFDESVYDMLVKLKEEKNPECRRSNYFPVYRA